MSGADDSVPRHPIGVVAQRTGLTLATLRAWERRYSAIEPSRTMGSHRLYTGEEVERLQLLARAVRGGWSIGRIAGHSTEMLRGLVEGSEEGGITLAPMAAPETATEAGIVARCMEATRRMDGGGLEGELRRARLNLGVMSLVQGVVFPMLRQVGEGWEGGELSVAHEHLASAVVRQVLGELVASGSGATGAAPVLVSGTLSGQMHELGALTAAVIAVSAGWRVIYLGPDLPAEEVAAAARQAKARAAAVGLVTAPKDGSLPIELRRLRSSSPPGTELIAGGPLAVEFRGLLDSLGYHAVPDMPAFLRLLHTLAP